MFHKRCDKSAFGMKSSGGFLIPLSAILLLGIGVLAVAINRIASQSTHSSVVEGISIQAFYAAESGAYFGMNQLMFDTDDSGVADTNCAGLTGSAISFTATGLQNCSANITCTVDTVVGSPLSFYTIRSDASCGSGDIFAERTVEVSSYL